MDRTPHLLLCKITPPPPHGPGYGNEFSFFISLRALRARLISFLASCLLLCYAEHNTTEQCIQSMVGGMVQNSQSLYLFTFNALIIIHEYIYPHSTAKFTFKNYINSHLTTCFLFRNIFIHIYEMYSFTFNGLYSFTFMIEILVQQGAIFIQHVLRITFAHYLVPAPAP